jgi:RNA polymerase sigma-70 factor (ECF subfamily)
MEPSRDRVGRLEDSDPSDLELLKRVADGDEVAFGLLSARLGPILKRVLLRLGLTAPEVDDAIQEVLIKLWKGSAGFQARSSVSTWACRIAVNQGISVLHRRPRLAAIEPVSVQDPELVWQEQQLMAAVRAAVNALPLSERTVIVLREYEGMSYREIAAALGIPIGTVMSRLHSARSKVRRRLARGHQR